jgi:hypothetical protein
MATTYTCLKRRFGFELQKATSQHSAVAPPDSLSIHRFGNFPTANIAATTGSGFGSAHGRSCLTGVAQMQHIAGRRPKPRFHLYMLGFVGISARRRAVEDYLNNGVEARLTRDHLVSG